jgi:hypothetical protein
MTNGNAFPILNLVTTHPPLEQGLVRVSNSPYVAPIVMVEHLMDLYDCIPIS